MGCNNVNIKGLSKLSYMTKVNLIGVLSIKNGFELNKLKRKRLILRRRSFFNHSIAE